MNDKSIRIDDKIIDPTHIIAIDLHAEIYSYKDSKLYPGIRLIMSAIFGEFGTMANGAGNWEPFSIEYVNEQAEVLRPWLAEMFPCNGRSIRLPEVAVLEAEEGNDTEKAKRCFRCDEVITVPFKDLFCSEVCAKIFVGEMPF